MRISLVLITISIHHHHIFSLLNKSIKQFILAKINVNNRVHIQNVSIFIQLINNIFNNNELNINTRDIFLNYLFKTEAQNTRINSGNKFSPALHMRPPAVISN